MIIDLIGVPFLKIGRKATGADCLGLGLLAQKEIGHESVTDPWEFFLEHAHAWDEHQAPPGWESVEPSEGLQPGDMLQHAQSEDRKEDHITVVAESGWVLQTSSAVEQSFLMPMQKFLDEHGPDIVAVWRWRG